MENERVSQAERSAQTPGLDGMRPLILASGSPRRAEILRAVGWPFEAYAPDVDESRREAESPEGYVQRLAREKAEAVARTRLFGLVLGADTTVVVGGEIRQADGRERRAAVASAFERALARGSDGRGVCARGDGARNRRP